MVDWTTDLSGRARTGTPGALEGQAAIVAGNPIADTFTAANDTPIDGRTPETTNGSQWAEYGATTGATIQGNAVRFAAAYNGALVQFGTPNQRVSVRFSPGGGQNDFIVNVRSDSTTDNRYYLHFETTLDRLRLVKVVGASQSQITAVPYAINENADYDIVVTCLGSSLTVSVNGSEEISETDSDITAGDYCGIEHGAYDTAAARADNFGVVSAYALVNVPAGTIRFMGAAPRVSITGLPTVTSQAVPAGEIRFTAAAPRFDIVVPAVVAAASARPAAGSSNAGASSPRPRQVIVGTQSYQINYNDGRHVVFGPRPTSTPPRRPPKNQRPTPRLMMAANGGNMPLKLKPSRKPPRVVLGVQGQKRVKLL